MMPVTVCKNHALDPATYVHFPSCFESVGWSGGGRAVGGSQGVDGMSGGEVSHVVVALVDWYVQRVLVGRGGGWALG